MKRKQPFFLLLSGFIQGLIFNALAGVVGVLFIIFGFLGSITVLKIVGVFAFGFYIIVSIVNPTRALYQASEQVTEREYNKITEIVLHSEGSNILSYYDRVINAIEEKNRPQTEISEEVYSDDEYTEYTDATVQKSNADKAQDDTYKATPITKFIGIIFVLAAVYFAFQAISTYARQIDAEDWQIAMAEVTDVNTREEYESGGRKRSGHYVTVYDITYQYYVGSDVYTGKIIGSHSPKAIGEHFDIKYDPNSSENSTEILEPQTDVLVINLAGSFAFAIIGMLVSGLLPQLLRSIKRRLRSARSK